jgi:hypothetical protein
MIEAPRGRGPQLAAGAEQTQGNWLLFLHADSALQGDWLDEVADFVGDDGNARRAAAFRFAIDLPGAKARSLERAVAWRSRVLALPYGDQGLLIAKPFYRELGGYRQLPLMEDVDLIRRIGRARLSLFQSAILTSGERYRRAGLIPRVARNLTCLTLYFLGLPPRLIARLYG